jgi:Fe-S cluster biogenesis protein NfuA/nitrite reductase/ring-hydroxylating ferredoxin subunit
MNTHATGSERIEQLLEQLEATAGPATWGRVQELVERLLDLYGAALKRIVEEGGSDSAWLRAVAEDQAVSGLLILHGLHPLSAEERARRALQRVRPYLGSHSGDVELLSIDEAGRARLRLVGTCRGCPSSRATVEGMIRRALEDAAPELSEIDVEGVAEPPPSGSVASAGVANARWRDLDGLPPLPEGKRCAIELEGVQVLLIGGARNQLAYRNQCPACGARLDGAVLEEPVLACAGCGRRFDVAKAGRAVDTKGPHLQPFPLLQQNGALRISLPVAKS